MTSSSGVDAARHRDRREPRRSTSTGLFVAIGHDPRSELVRGQVHLDDEGYVLVEPGSTQDQPARRLRRGDLVDHTYRQAVTAAGTGCAAALDAERYLADLAYSATVPEPADAELLTDAIQPQVREPPPDHPPANTSERDHRG